MNESNFELNASAFADWARDCFYSNSEMALKECLEGVDGRRERKHPTVCRGSYVYVAYENEAVLYVGETGEYVRTRFKGDGSGAHQTKDWYGRMTHVRFWKLPSKSYLYRKLVEAALIFALRPLDQTAVRGARRRGAQRSLATRRRADKGAKSKVMFEG